MLTVISILFILLIAYSMGWKEVAYSFFDIHVGDVLKWWIFALCLVFSLGVGVPILLLMSSGFMELIGSDAFVLLSAMVCTILLLWMQKRHFSVVTAFWGATIGLLSVRHSLTSSHVLHVLISLVAAPLLSVLLALLLLQLFRRYLFNSRIHLIMKSWWVKCLLVVGCWFMGILLMYNYSLLIDTLLSAIIPESDRTWGFWIIAAIVCAISLVPVFLLTYQRRRYGNIGHSLSSIYSQTIVLAICNFLLPMMSVGLAPVLLPVNLMRESNTIAMEGSKGMLRFINVLTIGIITPLLAFIFALLFRWLTHDPLLMAAILIFIFSVALLVRLYYLQRDKQRKTRRLLFAELQRKDEVAQELNRSDVAAITSQFYSLSTEMNFKQKELVNLSLSIQQQHDYLHQVEQRLLQIIKEQDTTQLRDDLSALYNELHEHLLMPRESERLYGQVEEMQQDFISRLQMRCPELTTRERRLAILLRLGLSSKEIASMMNLETKSVEINRYRLRKKMNLHRSENIVHYLQMI